MKLSYFESVVLYNFIQNKVIELSKLEYPEVYKDWYIKESVERPALFCANYLDGRWVEKWIKNTLSVFNPLKLVDLGVFRGFRDDFLD